MRAETAQRSGLPALTGARFFAAFSVVVYHYGSAALEPVSPLLARMSAVGPAAVSFFYVLSGAVLTWGCTDADGRLRRPTFVFWGQRAARILPAYLLALLLSAVPFSLQVLKLHPGAGGAFRVAIGLGSALLLVQTLWPQIAAGPNVPGWSISCEAFFYAVWPRLVSWRRPSRPGLPWRAGLWLWAAALAPTAIGLCLLATGALPAGAFATLVEDVSAGELLARTLTYFPPLRLPEFALGIALGHALKSTPERPRSVAADTLREAALLAILLAAGLALGLGLPSRLIGLPLADRIVIEGGSLAPIFALWVWQLARGRGLGQRLLSTPALLGLGEASYALYILQEPLFVWLTAALKRSAPAAMRHWTLTFWGYAALLVVASVAVHKLVELPLRQRLLARLSPRPGAA